jgi:hypothetical protein
VQYIFQKLRPIAVSRKNFLFCGNHEAAQNTAVISKMPYLQKPGNDETLKALLPNKWKKEKSNNTLTITGKVCNLCTEIINAKVNEE